MELNKLLTYGTTVGSLALGWVGGIKNLFETAVLESVELCIDGDTYDVEVGDELDLENIFPPVGEGASKYYIGAINKSKDKKHVIKRYNAVLNDEEKSWYSFVNKIPVRISVGARSKPSAGQNAVERIALIQFPRGLLRKEVIWDKLLTHIEKPPTNRQVCKLCFGNSDFSEIVYPNLPLLKTSVVCTHLDKEEKWFWNSEVETLLAEVRRFMKSKEWFIRKNIPWRFGILLHGIPGNGKSEFINAIEEEHDLSRCSLVSEKDSLQKDSDGNLFVIEDYDSVFNGRQNKSLNKKGDFSDLLQIFDSHRGIAIITTNDLSCIDKALGIPESDGRSSRPGRINRVVNMINPNNETKVKIARKIFGAEKEIEGVLQNAHNDTYAQFVDRCSSIALKEFWDNEDPSSR